MILSSATSVKADTLFVRLSATTIHLVRRDDALPSGFAFFTQRLNPKTSLTANLRELARTTELLQAPTTDRVQVLVNGPATFVPLAEFQEEDCETLYNFCQPQHRDGYHEVRRRVFYDVVGAANSVVLFALNDTTCRALEDLLGTTPHYVSSFTPLVRHFADKASARLGQKRFYVYARGKQVDIVVLDGSHLLQAGSYDIGGVADVAYYLLSTARHFGARLTDADVVEADGSVPDTFHVAADGEALRDEVVAELRKYAADVVAVNPLSEFNRHPAAALPGIPYDLLNLLME